jgi:hypothetical protein
MGAKDAAGTTEVVLISGALFTSLFVQPRGPANRLNVDYYKLPAHVRKITTDRMADANTDSEGLSTLKTLI